MWKKKGKIVPELDQSLSVCKVCTFSLKQFIISYHHVCKSYIQFLFQQIVLLSVSLSDPPKCKVAFSAFETQRSKGQDTFSLLPSQMTSRPGNPNAQLSKRNVHTVNSTSGVFLHSRLMCLLQNVLTQRHLVSGAVYKKHSAWWS